MLVRFSVAILFPSVRAGPVSIAISFSLAAITITMNDISIAIDTRRMVTVITQRRMRLLADTVSRGAVLSMSTSVWQPAALLSSVQERRRRSGERRIRAADG